MMDMLLFIKSSIHQSAKRDIVIFKKLRVKMEKLKILIIDDDVALCESLSDILEVENYLVESSYAVKDGIEKVEQDFYNIVLLDMKLPDPDGI